MAALRDVLRMSSLFSMLEKEQLEGILPKFIKGTAKRNRLIYAEGDIGQGLYLADSGWVRLVKQSESGKEQVIYFIKRAGESFGELSLFHGGRHSVSAFAHHNVTYYLLPREEFIALTHLFPQIAVELLEVTACRFVWLTGLIEQLSFNSVSNRVATALLLYAETEGLHIDQGIRLKSSPTRKELASIAGTGRELVSRILRRLESEHIIAMDDRFRITITNKQELTKLTSVIPSSHQTDLRKKTPPLIGGGFH